MTKPTDEKNESKKAVITYKNGMPFVNGNPTQRILRKGKIVLVSKDKDFPEVQVPFVLCNRCTNPNSARYIRPGILRFGDEGASTCLSCDGHGRLYPEKIMANRLRLETMTAQAPEMLNELLKEAQVAA